MLNCTAGQAYCCYLRLWFVVLSWVYASGPARGSKGWLTAFTTFLVEHAGVELCIDDIAEQVLSAGLLHVDDTLASGSRGRLECVLDVIKSKYRVSAEMMIQEGDEISCLKRKHGKARAVGRWCVEHPPLN